MVTPGMEVKIIKCRNHFVPYDLVGKIGRIFCVDREDDTSLVIFGDSKVAWCDNFYLKRVSVWRR